MGFFFWGGVLLDCNYLHNLVYHFSEGVSSTSLLFCSVISSVISCVIQESE